MYSFNVGDEVLLVPSIKDAQLFGIVGRVIDKYGRGYFVSYIDPWTGEPFEGAFSFGELLPVDAPGRCKEYSELVDEATRSNLAEGARYKVAERINREFPDASWGVKKRIIEIVTDKLGLYDQI